MTAVPVTEKSVTAFVAAPETELEDYWLVPEHFQA